MLGTDGQKEVLNSGYSITSPLRGIFPSQVGAGLWYNHAMEHEPKRIPYGVINYAELVRECHFVDNTAYLRALERVKTPIFLRPKRFGKSLWCSLLGYYYDVKEKGNFAELFGPTDVGKRPTPLANSFLVLKFDFSVITVGTLAELELNFIVHVRGCVRNFAARYADLADWSSAFDLDDAAAMVTELRNVVARNGLPPLYVIVDEYDNFTNELVVSGRDAEYDAVCGHGGGEVRESFFKAFFKSFKAGLADGTVGRTYFTGVLPITLDDLSSGFNVGTVVSLNPSLVGMVGFTQAQVERYVGGVFADYGFDPSLLPAVLSDLKAFYDGYHFMPGTEPLYNATICNWYLHCLAADGGKIPSRVLDANLRTDVGWFRRLAGSNENALARVRAYVERGEGEVMDVGGLSVKFGRAKFFSKEFFPYALYYLGLLTFADRFTLAIPNLTARNMFVDYYDELSRVSDGGEASRRFLTAAKALALGAGTWRDLFAAYWTHYVKARIPAQAFDQMNENFFRTTFTSRAWDALAAFYSFETEYNTPAGRVDFLATPKPGYPKPAMLVEFKYFTNAETDRIYALERTAPDAETAAQARRYRDSLRLRPGWTVPVCTAVVEVCGSRGWNWFDVG